MKPATQLAVTAVAGGLVALAACGGSGGPGRAAPAPAASASLRDSVGARIGVATLTERGDTLELGVSVGGLTPGPHGLHFHAAGRCEPPDFSSAGPHFNPERRKHGLENPEGPHLGDLPNLVVGADGSADSIFVVSGDLIGGGPRSLLGPEGGALVIHAAPDDGRTDPSGNSGARVACGVIERD